MEIANEKILAGFIDHTILKPETTSQQIKQHCEEVKTYCFAAVSVNPRWVPLAADLLHGSKVAVGGVVSLPFGADFTKIKVAQAIEMLEAGADRIGTSSGIQIIEQFKARQPQ